MENLFQEYLVDKHIDWHTYEPGNYHVTGVGISHEDMEPDEHYGPCIRKTFYNYVNFREHDDGTKGNFRFGKIIHEEIQDIRTKNKPSVIAEFPIEFYINRETNKIDDIAYTQRYSAGFNKEDLPPTNQIIIRGSIDLVEFDLIGGNRTVTIDDIKTSSSFSFPQSPYSWNPTYIDQISLYTYITKNFLFNNNYIDEYEMGIVTAKKQFPSLKIVRQSKNYDSEIAGDKYNEFIRRCWKLHDAILSLELPKKEPFKYCKYCRYDDLCEKDVIFNE